MQGGRSNQVAIGSCMPQRCAKSGMIELGLVAKYASVEKIA
jgi:hypothetical protein